MCRTFWPSPKSVCLQIRTNQLTCKALQVSKRALSVSNSVPLWRNLAAGLERDGIILAIDTCTVLAELPLRELKSVVLRTATVWNAWRSPESSNWLRTYHIKLPADVRSSHTGGDWIAVTNDYLAVSMGYGMLMGVNRKTGKCVGTYDPKDRTYSHDQSWYRNTSATMYKRSGYGHRTITS